jgi:hypothetical protein
MRATLHIAHTWDGAPLDHHERATLSLHLTPNALTVEVDAPFHGDPPPPLPPGRCPALWEREVIELFLVAPDGQYLELELGPHGHHLAIWLSGVRQIARDDLPVTFTARRDRDRWTGLAMLDAALLPPRPWRWNAYAIHGLGPQRRHLAMTPLPGPRPDFHQPHRFTSHD